MSKPLINTVNLIHRRLLKKKTHQATSNNTSTSIQALSPTSQTNIKYLHKDTSQTSFKSENHLNTNTNTNINNSFAIKINPYKTSSVKIPCKFKQMVQEMISVKKAYDNSSNAAHSKPSNHRKRSSCSSSGNNCNGNELPITKVMVPDKENNDVDFIYKLYQEEKKKQRDEQLNKKENSNVHIEEKEEPKKSKIDRIQEIVLKGFNDEIILSKLKAHFGDNFEERIINEEVSDEYLHEVEKKIIEYSTNTDEQCDNTTNNANINQFPEKEQLPSLDTYLRSKDKETISKRKNNIDNSESCSTLKKYFLFNLKRDLMLSRGKKQ